MPFTQFTNLDFDEIKAQIKDFLRSNSNFSGFDFEGSNFSVLIDTLAYNTYINAFNANLIANESFLDSATIRENVVSLARNIGYVPRSKTAATATIRISDINLGTTTDNTPKFLTLRSGLVCVGNAENTTFRFSIPEDVTSTRVRDIGGTSFAQFNEPITIYEGTYLSRVYRVDNSKKQNSISSGFSLNFKNDLIINFSTNNTNWELFTTDSYMPSGTIESIDKTIHSISLIVEI